MVVYFPPIVNFKPEHGCNSAFQPQYGVNLTLTLESNCCCMAPVYPIIRESDWLHFVTAERKTPTLQRRGKRLIIRGVFLLEGNHECGFTEISPKKAAL